MSFKSELSEDTKQYLADKKVPQLMEHLFHELAVATPSDPLQFLVELLSKKPKPRVFVLGMPCSGKSSVAKQLATKHGVPVINFDQLLSSNAEASKALAAASASSAAAAAAVSSKLVVEAVKGAAKSNGGWILEGFPRTRSEAVGLQAGGVLPSLVLVLECDSETGQNRITDDMDTAGLVQQGRLYALNSAEVLALYANVQTHSIDARGSLDEVVAACEPLLDAVLTS